MLPIEEGKIIFSHLALVYILYAYWRIPGRILHKLPQGVLSGGLLFLTLSQLVAKSIGGVRVV